MTTSVLTPEAIKAHMLVIFSRDTSNPEDYAQEFAEWLENSQEELTIEALEVLTNILQGMDDSTELMSGEIINMFTPYEIVCIWESNPVGSLKEAFSQIEENNDKSTIDAICHYAETETFWYDVLTEEEAEENIKDMYRGDEYILGAFNAWFIAENTDLDIEIIEALQEAEKFEALGRTILKNEDWFNALIIEAIRQDGIEHMSSENIKEYGQFYVCEK